ncbi:MAG TPA: glycerol-3-phosphate acyltransferase [Acidimicrobiales bacterium]
MLAAAVLVVAAYLLGAFPTAALVARRFGHDPIAEGSGNPGASNVMRVAGTRAGLFVFAGDVAKGAIATGAGMALDGRDLALACGLAAVIGHTRPPVRRKGGRGVAAGAGTVLVLFPVHGAVALVTWLTLVRLVGRASVASLTIVVGLPVSLAIGGTPGRELAGIALLAAYLVVRHADNISRLVRGEERMLREPGTTA